jgi:DeoR/GlpR family transcriptional regulator of sugar metabolism
MGMSGRMTSARRRRLLDQLELKEFARVSELAASFRVSEITIRRDLDELAEQGLIERFHGGGRLIARRQAISPSGAGVTHELEKRVIAAAAARFVRPGDTVMISGGTTTLALFREIAGMEIQVITNNTLLVGAVDGKTAASLFLLGGEYNRNTRALNGDMTNLALNQIHGSICFLGTNAISQHNGLTSTIHAAAAVNHLMASQCKGNVVVVTDSSKIGKTSHFVSLKLPEVRVLVTDDGADPAEIAAYRANGIETLICQRSPNRDPGFAPNRDPLFVTGADDSGRTGAA